MVLQPRKLTFSATLPALQADCEGHGTHVAAAVGGLTFGVAPGAKLHAVRILDCEGSGAGDREGVQEVPMCCAS